MTTDFRQIVPLEHLAQMLDESVPLKKRIDLLGQQIRLHNKLVVALRKLREPLIDQLNSKGENE